jgi:small-conductance mechanosensitive channel
MSRFSRISPFVRGLLIIAAIAALVVVFQLEQTLTALYILARVAFILAIAYFIFLMWRERREGISMWSARAQWVFYGAAAVAVADVGVYWYGGAVGYEVLAFVAILVLCGFAMWRTWRDQHTYV